MSNNVAKIFEQAMMAKLALYEKELQALDNRPKAEDLYPTINTYERMSYEPLSEEDLKLKANNELNTNYDSDREKIIKTIEDNIASLKSSSGNIEEKQLQQLEIIENAYNKLMSSINSDTIKRGLQRSSIASGQIENVLTSKKNDEIAINSQATTRLSEIDGEIKKLENSVETSLEAYDLQHANKIMERINTLKQEQQQILNSVNAHNNSLTEKEKKELEERNLKIAQEEEKRYKEALEQEKYEYTYGYSPVKDTNYQARYDLALTFYSSKSK